MAEEISQITPSWEMRCCTDLEEREYIEDAVNMIRLYDHDVRFIFFQIFVNTLHSEFDLYYSIGVYCHKKNCVLYFARAIGFISLMCSKMTCTGYIWKYRLYVPRLGHCIRNMPTKNLAFMSLRAHQIDLQHTFTNRHAMEVVTWIA